MKCAFCGTTHEVEEQDGIILCKECHGASMDAKKRTEWKRLEEEKEVEEIKVEEMDVVQEAAPEQTGIRCELSIGVTNEGALYFNVYGDNTDLLTIDGLLAFAQRRMREVWRSRDAALATSAKEE